MQNILPSPRPTAPKHDLPRNRGLRLTYAMPHLHLHHQMQPAYPAMHLTIPEIRQKIRSPILEVSHQDCRTRNRRKHDQQHQADASTAGTPHKRVITRLIGLERAITSPPKSNTSHQRRIHDTDSQRPQFSYVQVSTRRDSTKPPPSAGKCHNEASHFRSKTGHIRQSQISGSAPYRWP